MSDNMIDLCHEKLQPFKTYYISNASVKQVDKKLMIDDIPIHWTITSKCLIEDASDNIDAPIDEKYNYASFKDFPLYLDITCH